MGTGRHVTCNMHKAFVQNNLLLLGSRLSIYTRSLSLLYPPLVSVRKVNQQTWKDKEMAHEKADVQKHEAEVLKRYREQLAAEKLKKPEPQTLDLEAPKEELKEKETEQQDERSEGTVELEEEEKTK